MRSVFFLLCITLLSLQAEAQPAGFSEVKNKAALQKSLAETNTKTQTIVSDFTQKKTLQLLTETLTSKGKFYYKQPNKMRIQYQAPYQYLVVYQGGQMMVKDEKQTNKINTRGSKSMQSLNRIMVDCMNGSVMNNTDFKTTAYENGRQYLLSMLPVDAAMRRLFKQIDVYMDKDKYNVVKLVMTELKGDKTEMNFINTKTNIAVDEGLFKLR